jgi:hypothetical protein
MNLFAISILVRIAGGIQGYVFNGEAAAGMSHVDPIEPWKAYQSTEGGFTAAFPCRPLPKTSDPEDGYGHHTKEFELRCSQPVRGGGKKFFRLTRITYPEMQGLARENFDRYRSYVRSDHSAGPKVMVVGQISDTHVDYVLRNGVQGDLGFIQSHENCRWNFRGISAESEISILVMLPKSACPEAEKSSIPDDVKNFFDSIVLNSE